MKKKMCESCMMPLDKDQGKRENDKYCSLCFKDGKLCYQGNDLKEFQREVRDNIIKSGKSKFFANFAAFMVRFAPRWKKK